MPKRAKKMPAVEKQRHDARGVPIRLNGQVVALSIDEISERPAPPERTSLSCDWEAAARISELDRKQCFFFFAYFRDGASYRSLGMTFHEAGALTREITKKLRAHAAELKPLFGRLTDSEKNIEKKWITARKGGVLGTPIERFRLELLQEKQVELEKQQHIFNELKIERGVLRSRRAEILREAQGKTLRTVSALRNEIDDIDEQLLKLNHEIPKQCEIVNSLADEITGIRSLQFSEALAVPKKRFSRAIDAYDIRDAVVEILNLATAYQITWDQLYSAHLFPIRDPRHALDDLTERMRARAKFEDGRRLALKYPSSVGASVVAGVAP
jgi:hypothetical protein